MQMITDIQIDLYGEEQYYLASAKQGDKATRFLRVQLMNNGNEFQIPDDVTLIANIQKPDGKFCYNECEIENNRVLVKLTNQALAAAGTAHCDIELRTKSGELILSSAAFTIEIEKSMRNENAILSCNEMTALDRKVQEYIDRMMEARKQVLDTEEAIKIAENAREKAEADRIQEEESREQAEVERTKGEEARKQAEEARTAAENDRVQQLQQMQTATTEAEKAAKNAFSAAEHAEELCRTEEELSNTLTKQQELYKRIIENKAEIERLIDEWYDEISTFKAVSTAANQGLSYVEKLNARDNIGAVGTNKIKKELLAPGWYRFATRISGYSSQLVSIVRFFNKAAPENYLLSVEVGYNGINIVQLNSVVEVQTMSLFRVVHKLTNKGVEVHFDLKYDVNSNNTMVVNIIPLGTFYDTPYSMVDFEKDPDVAGYNVKEIALSATPIVGDVNGTAELAKKVIDSYDGRALKIAYGAPGLDKQPLWMAAWADDGKSNIELRALSPSKMSIGNATKLDNKPATYFAPQAHYYSGYKNEGYYKIKIKSTTTWMLQCMVMLYQDYKSYTLIVSGYNYGNDHWYRSKAELVSASDDINLCEVKFGYDEDGLLWFAVPASWYTGLTICNINNGYTQVSDWGNQFEIIHVSTLSGTVQNTYVAYRPYRRNETVAAADTVDGFHASKSNVAETAVVRDGNGYIYVKYISSDTGNGEGHAISQFITTNGNDNYYRKSSISGVKTQLGIDELKSEVNELKNSISNGKVQAANADTVDGIHIKVVTSLPSDAASHPDTLYIIPE